MKRVGLFVGIDNYQNGITPLQCAVNDAKELSYSFARAGFQADFIDNEQCDSITITNKIRAMLKDLKKDDIFVFYFSGHGREHSGSHYLAGVNSLPEDALFSVDALSVSVLVALTNQVPGLNRLFILDCCRNDILAGKNGVFTCDNSRDIALNGAVKQSANPEIIPPLILNSCSTGQRAFEDLTTKHGYFTKSLISAIENRNIHCFQEFANSLTVAGTPMPQTVSWNGNLNTWNSVPLFEKWGSLPPSSSDISKYLLYGKKKEIEKLSDSLDGEIPAKVDELLKAAEIAEKEGDFAAALKLLNQAFDRLNTPWENTESIEEEKTTPRWAEVISTEKQLSKIELPGGISLEMAKIPAGSFVMGTPAVNKSGFQWLQSIGQELGLVPDERQHQVILTQDFWIGKYQVTQKQWQALMEYNPSVFTGDNHPVECVSWDEVKEFCRKLNELNRKKLPAGYQFDLPTEAQWEYTCRAGTTTDLNNSANLMTNKGYCVNLEKVGWFFYNSEGTTHPVGEKSPNAWGLYDMHGNVFEWCRDWKGFYPMGVIRDPTGPLMGSVRVIRGGGWSYLAEYCRSSYRLGYNPLHRNASIGFRLALVPIQ